ncbi:MAG: septum formation initiator family protein [Firmicutes bacterium]|nr:septum formation initiator family protein [Bacillota bacterium]
MSHQRALAEDHLRSSRGNGESDLRSGGSGWRNRGDDRRKRGRDRADYRQVGQAMARATYRPAGTRTRARVWLSKPAAAAVLLFGLYLFTGYISGFVKIAGLYHQIAQTRHEIASVQEKNRDLQKRIEELNSPSYTEKVARETLGLIKKGEVKYMVAEPMDKQDPSYLEVQKRPGSKNNDNFY